MLDILYEDKSIAVCVKRAGLLSEGEGADCLPSLLCAEIASRRSARGEDAKETSVFPVHRLDRETEGVMVYALTKQAASELSAQIASHSFEKIYTARLWGIPERERDTLCDLLFYDRTKGRSFAVKRERKGVKRAELQYEIIEKNVDGRTSLVRIKLGTGRTHQIRVQFASRGLPLCGDRRYGAPAESGKALALTATELSFTHPVSRKPMRFSVEPSWK